MFLNLYSGLKNHQDLGKLPKLFPARRLRFLQDFRTLHRILDTVPLEIRVDNHLLYSWTLGWIPNAVVGQ